MNSLICFLTVYHLFYLLKNRFYLSKLARRLIYLGILLPLGDYILRFVLGEFWFYSGQLVFHSFIYQLIFWGIAALLYWVYSRDLSRSLKLFLPILGLFFYLVFSLFGTEHLTFFAPLSSFSLHLDWINAGYLIPAVFSLLLLISKRWSEFSSRTIGKLSLGVLVIFLLLAGVIRFNAVRSMPAEIADSGLNSILPANNLQTEWNVINYQDGLYRYNRYHFVQGFRLKFEQIEAFEDFYTTQSVLADPTIRNFCLYGFKNPQVKVEIQNEILKINISELQPLAALLWIRQAQIIRNRSGLIVDINVQYGSVI